MSDQGPIRRTNASGALGVTLGAIPSEADQRFAAAVLRGEDVPPELADAARRVRPA